MNMETWKQGITGVNLITIILVFLYFLIFLPNAGRVLATLIFNGCDLLYVNTGRILLGFGRKLRNIGKLERVLYQPIKYAKLFKQNVS